MFFLLHASPTILARLFLSKKCSRLSFLGRKMLCCFCACGEMDADSGSRCHIAFIVDWDSSNDLYLFLCINSEIAVSLSASLPAWRWMFLVILWMILFFRCCSVVLDGPLVFKSSVIALIRALVKKFLWLKANIYLKKLLTAVVKVEPPPSTLSNASPTTSSTLVVFKLRGAPALWKWGHGASVNTVSTIKFY